MIHRDIKPGNLKLTPEGRLKILDFGIAQLRPSGTQTTVTGSNQSHAAGTIPYMAPEQIEGVPPDARTDVYAAGAVLYELATGTRAFPDEHQLALLDAVLRRPAPPPRLLRPELSGAFEACVMQALEKDPARRHQSAEELGRALAALDRAAVGAPAWRARPLHRVRPLAWIALAVAIVAAGVARTQLPREPSIASGDPAPPALQAQVRLAVLPPQNLTNRAVVDGWLPLIQALFTTELTGVQELGIIDSFSLNARLRPEGEGHDLGVRQIAALKELGATLMLDGHIVPADAGLQLQAHLIDPERAEVRFTTKADINGETDLPRAVRSVSQAILSYVQLQVFKLAETRDMQPWLRLRERNIEAVKAFVQANQYIYRFHLAPVEGLLRRALELDPGFIAPRLWLFSQLLAKGNRAEAEREYEELKKLEASASPFDQAMIGFAGAMFRDDDAGQIRYLGIALDYSPGNNILLVNLASARARTGDCASALEDLDGPVRMRWEYPPLYSLWGWCAIQTGRFEDARRVLQSGAQLPTVDPYVFGLLAGLEAAFGTAADAARFDAEFQERRAQLGRTGGDPQLAGAYEMLAHDCEKRGDRSRAANLVAMRDRLAAPPR